jgi:hypothetical protein
MVHSSWFMVSPLRTTRGRISVLKPLSMSSRAGGRVGKRGTPKAPLMFRFSAEPRGRNNSLARGEISWPRDLGCSQHLTRSAAYSISPTSL